jgi:hypothetical protein
MERHRDRRFGAVEDTRAMRPVIRVQRKCACGNHAPGEDACDNCRANEEGLTVQRSATHPVMHDEVPGRVYDVVRTAGQPLDRSTRAAMEAEFGTRAAAVMAARIAPGRSSIGARDGAEEHEADRVSTAVARAGDSGSTRTARDAYDFSHVRIHTDSAARDSARSLNARAYTVGSHLVFAPEQYAPGTAAGRQLLAHELTHVVQQNKAGSAVVSRQPEEQPTRRQIARDNQLRRLAVWPAEALHEWRRLSEAERTVVVLYMLGNYGADFANQFNANAKNRRRRQPVTHVTNVITETAPQLQRRGYRFVTMFGNMEKWVHPSGDELWRILPSPSPAREQAEEAPPGQTQQPPASNPTRYDPSADPRTLFGAERQSRTGGTVMGQRGRVVQHADGTIVLYPDGSSGRVIYRPTPGGTAYEYYGEDGERVENVFITIELDEIFGGTSGAATP